MTLNELKHKVDELIISGYGDADVITDSDDDIQNIVMDSDGSLVRIYLQD